MKSLSLVSYALLAATAVAQFDPFPPNPWDTALTSTGMTLLAPLLVPSGNVFTNITVTLDFPIIGSSVSTAGLEWITLYASVDLMPVSFDFIEDTGLGADIPFPATCPDFLQVGVNVTQNFLTDDDAENSVGVTEAFAFFTWNNVTTNITDANGDLVTFVPGETVNITLLLNEDGTSATVLYESTIHGLIEFSLTGGSLCLESVQWAAGSPVLTPCLGFKTDITNARAGMLDLARGNSSIFGPDSGAVTILDTDLGGISQIAGPFFFTDSGFTFLFDADDFDY